MKKTFIILFVIAIFMINSTIFAFESLMMVKNPDCAACVDAERDSYQDQGGGCNDWFWAGMGILFPVGYPLSFLLPIEPKSERLLGKSPEYIEQYTEYFKEKGLNTRQNWVLTLAGCFWVPAIITIIIWRK